MAACQKLPHAVSLPTVKVSPRGAARLKDGHVWVYRSDIVSADGVLPGSLVRVTDHRGKPLGTRPLFQLLANRHPPDLPRAGGRSSRPASPANRRGHRLSRTLVHDTDAYRVIFSEADFLPGLIVDRYNDILSLQILTQAMDADPVRETIISDLTERLHPASIIERVDPRVRELEPLPPRDSGLLHGEKSATIFTMNGVQFHYDASKARRPEPSSISAKTTPPPPNTPTEKRSTSSAIREASPFTSPRAARSHRRR